MAVPAMRDGKAAYLVLVTFEIGHFQQRLDRLALPANWSLSLLDGRGDVIARRSPLWMTPGQKEDAARSFVVKSSVSPWTVVLEISGAAYRAPLFSAATALVFGILGATLFGVLGGMLAGRRLGRAVAGLASTPTPGIRPPEILEIAAVRRQLDEATALRDSNQILEQKVAERTMELAEARDRIATFAAEQERAIEQDRRRLSREVHDQIRYLPPSS